MTLLSLAQDAAAAAPAAAADDSYFLWGCLLFGAALVLLVIELFVPSGGLIGILCGVAAIASIVSFFLYDTSWGVGVSLAYVLLTPITLVFVFKLWINSPVGKAMVLGATVTAGDEESVARSEHERQARLASLRQLIGAEGITETALRPVGTVRIDGQRTDAMAETGVIEANTPVVVTDIYDNQIKVRPI